MTDEFSAAVPEIAVVGMDQAPAYDSGRPGSAIKRDDAGGGGMWRGLCRRYPSAWAVLVTLPLCACSGPPGEAVARWTLSEELRIGSEASPEYALTEVAGIAVSGDGTTFVLQPKDEAVRVFDRDGRFLNYIGRPGEGPGEFRGLVGLGLRGDTVWVSDHRGIHRFEAGGRYLDSEMVRAVGGGPGLTPNGPDHVFSDGTLAVMPGFVPTLDRSAWPRHLPILRVRDGAVVGELAAFDLDAIQLYTPAGGRPRMAFRPFRPLAVYGYAPDGRSLAAVRQGAGVGPAETTFHLSRIDISGDTLVSRDVPYDPVAVPPAVRDSIEAAVSPANAAARFEAIPTPHHYPPVQALTIGDDGSVWLDMQGHAPSSRWLVVDEAGTVTATVTSDTAVRLFVVRGDRAWGVVRDELDVPYLVRFDIRPERLQEARQDEVARSDRIG